MSSSNSSVDFTMIFLHSFIPSFRRDLLWTRIWWRTTTRTGRRHRSRESRWPPPWTSMVRRNWAISPRDKILLRSFLFRFVGHLFFLWEASWRNFIHHSNSLFSKLAWMEYFASVDFYGQGMTVANFVMRLQNFHNATLLYETRSLSCAFE